MRVVALPLVCWHAGVSSGTANENEVDAGVFEEILATNVAGMMLTFQPFINAMRQHKRGTLAGVASVAGFAVCPAQLHIVRPKPQRSLTLTVFVSNCVKAAFVL